MSASAIVYYVLYACGDAEARLSSLDFYLRLWLPYLVKKGRTLKKHIYFECLLINYILI